VSLRRPRALRPGDRVAVLAPASAFPRDTFEAGIEELGRLGFVPVFDERVFATDVFEAGSAVLRAAQLREALADPAIAGIVTVRGGYGSVKLLPWLDPAMVRGQAKPLVGYSDLTTLLSFWTCQCGLVAFHGPMLDRRLSHGAEAYDRDSFLRCLCEAAPLGELAPPGLEALRPGDARGPLYGGTLTQLVASLGTPYAFDPPPGCVLWIEDVGERPYRLDRMLTQLEFAGLLARAAAVVVGEMRECDEAGGRVTARETIARALSGCAGPVLYNFPSGHTSRPFVTLPLGVQARVVAGSSPALVIEEAAVTGP